MVLVIPPFVLPIMGGDIEEDHGNDVKTWTLLLRSLKRVVEVVFINYLLLWFIPFFLLHKFSSRVRRSLLFLNFVRWPLRSNLKTPSKYGLVGTRNFYIESTDRVKLGVWQILPLSLFGEIPNENSESFFEQSLENKLPMILYMHGSLGTRATFHRIELYRLFQQLNFQVFTFDYRGYGDSSNVLPDEVGVVNDGKSIIRWLLARRNNAPLYVWGHSLGTAISSRVLYDLENEGIRIDGLILECPFNNLKDQIVLHPLRKPLRYMIGFNYLLLDSFVKNELSFRTEDYIACSTTNVLILTAEDDWIIPFTLGYKLYKYALQYRPNADQTVKYVQFSGKSGYGHRYICHSDNLPKILRQFTSGQLDKINDRAV